MIFPAVGSRGTSPCSPPMTTTGRPGSLPLATARSPHHARRGVQRVERLASSDELLGHHGGGVGLPGASLSDDRDLRGRDAGGLKAEVVSDFHDTLASGS